MEKYIIQGGTKVHGSITVRGAKNHALKVFAASLLSVQPLRAYNVPEIEDIFRLQEMLETIGVTVKHLKHGEYLLDAKTVKTTDLPVTLVPKLRASIVLTGALLTRFHKVSFPHPGGCVIGKRPIDLFIAGFEAFGAKHIERDGVHSFTAKQGLHGTRFVFPKISVTGTETLLLAAVLAKDTTTLVNVAREPEVIALAEYLNTQGAKISGLGTSTLTITGVTELSAGACNIIPDRIETLSFIFLALATKSKLTITECDPTTIAVPLQILQASGAKFTSTNNTITVQPWKKLKPITVTTKEYPDFPTDGQSPLTVLLTQISGVSEVTETIYTDRLFYIDLLNRMGANIVMHTPQNITVHGSTTLTGKMVASPDLRAGIAMVIAAVVATGKTEIGNIYQIDRGYEAIDKRLRAIGVNIKRVLN
ncbi:MAG: UDP-N-acetylglucosamine 1-carboxyvinyltransferase [Patescibacteria group bacterium]|jgi:UDP-N-acetylglucosamine 1-carboxyvinyltransferase